MTVMSGMTTMSALKQRAFDDMKLGRTDDCDDPSSATGKKSSFWFSWIPFSSAVVGLALSGKDPGELNDRSTASQLKRIAARHLAKANAFVGAAISVAYFALCLYVLSLADRGRGGLGGVALAVLFFVGGLWTAVLHFFINRSPASSMGYLSNGAVLVVSLFWLGYGYATGAACICCGGIVAIREPETALSEEWKTWFCPSEGDGSSSSSSLFPSGFGILYSLSVATLVCLSCERLFSFPRMLSHIAGAGCVGLLVFLLFVPNECTRAFDDGGGGTGGFRPSGEEVDAANRLSLYFKFVMFHMLWTAARSVTLLERALYRKFRAARDRSIALRAFSIARLAKPHDQLRVYGEQKSLLTPGGSEDPDLVDIDAELFDAPYRVCGALAENLAFVHRGNRDLGADHTPSTIFALRAFCGTSASQGGSEVIIDDPTFGAYAWRSTSVPITGSHAASFEILDVGRSAWVLFVCAVAFPVAAILLIRNVWAIRNLSVDLSGLSKTANDEDPSRELFSRLLDALARSR